MRAALFLLAALVPVLPASAQGGALDALMVQRAGRVVHYASTDPTGGNDDFRPIAPGETLTLLDHDGAGIVRRWWLTVAPRNVAALQRQLVVRCYWDGEAEPSVEVPLTDFFGVGFGEWTDYQSLPASMTSGGFNAYWPMPFRRGARITVENRSDVPVERFYYNVDVEAHERLPADVLYFHAQYRQTRTRAGEPVTVLETTGRGQYVGTVLSMRPRRGRGLGFLEGDERVFVDGEAAPSIVGTGTEDYFASGWYYDTGAYSAPYHGVPVKDEARGRISTYRWHVEDPIPFDESLRFTIEHGAANDAPDVDYASVAFYYQTHPHPPAPPLPANLLAQVRADRPEVEAETLLDRATVTGGALRVQAMEPAENAWGGAAQLWWVEARPGDRLTLPLDAPQAREAALTLFFTRATDYGVVRILVNGVPVGPLVDGYAPQVEPTGPVDVGRVPLRAGLNEVVVEIVGKDARSAGYSDGYLVGIDGLTLAD